MRQGVFAPTARDWLSGTRSASHAMTEALMHRCARLAWSVFLIPALLMASLAACDPRRTNAAAAPDWAALLTTR